MPKDNVIKMEHGAGGEPMQALIRDLILNNIISRSAGLVGLDDLDDGATINITGILENKNSNVNSNDSGNCNNPGEIVITTDSHVITPAFFPDSNIGRLAVSGTVNDLAVMGAEPLALTCAMIVPEGFELSSFEKIVRSMSEAAEEVDVPIITGDTKTVERNGLDSIIINTTGIGIANEVIRDCGLCTGDKIILTGTIGDHGISLLAHREGFELTTDLVSDVAPLWNMLKDVVQIRTIEGKPAISAMKDPTRGGLAGTLNEMAQKSGTGISIEQKDLPIKEAVSSACEMLGIDPLEVANEGKAVICVKAENAEEVLSIIREHEYGKDAAIIGEATEENLGKVLMRTPIGSMRYVDPPTGDLIPRIC
ncbi:hydrogenase expression/formation protein HypE [Methanococcoides methylutens]|uniref:[NiFe] hydrogenase metallocenter assembly protein HypE n=1 Tax=Methanococcoides methylutens MM1 TaxID=1434104 RepID=A0A0E3SSJ4_METMT|nr:hydrogenase expression/formation protein HypE [Methanococcoides methylutens]AKB85392.1 [NiFe] hydrogenase metallocenter assembly protein HypE [Methanococcoides methylutens MM1]